MTIEFWEVGQGDCCVITAPSSELVVIDVGPINSAFVQWLARNAGTKFLIRHLVLTHNHLDHVGGMKALFRLSNVEIDSVYIVDDLVSRDDRNRVMDMYWRELFDRWKQGLIKSVRRIEPESGKPFQIWTDGDVSLVAVAPELDVNLARSNQDSTSAILALFVSGKLQFIWGGDADLRSVVQHISSAALEVLHGPHHGAPKDRYQSGFMSAASSINAAYAVFSLGTDNRYNSRATNAGRPQDFPNGKYVKELARRGCSVRCTQLTAQCDSVRGRSNSGGHVLQGSMLLGLVAAAGVACRGAMRWQLSGRAFIPDPYFTQHTERVRQLEKPMCL